MATANAIITPRLLTWARQRRRMPTTHLAKKMNVSPETVDAWEHGERLPTFRQARSLAQKLHIPFGYLYLRKPPTEEMPLADFRVTGRSRPEPSPNLLDHLNDTLGKQQWLKEYRVSEYEGKLPFVGRFCITDSETVVADDIRHTLNVDGARQAANSWEEFLRNLIRKAEGVGIVVMRSGVVSSNNRQPLDRTEFRGFSISDSIAPLVFINSLDFKGAQIFTLAHELAHIWTGKGGVSNPDYSFRSELPESSMERFCNRVAAETLVPGGDFLLRWQSNSTPLDDALESLRKYYKVSMMVILLQALCSNLITVPEYQMRYARLTELAYETVKTDDSGGDFYNTLISRHGRSFTEAIISSAAQGTTLSSEAAYMLGVQIKTLSGIAKHLYGSSLDLG